MTEQHQSRTDRHLTVFTPYYRANTPERQAELDLCLRNNLACPAIDRLVLLIDDGHVPPVRNSRLEVRRIQARPSYRDWVEMSQELPAGHISLLANSDIYFDDSLEGVHLALQGPLRFLALSRYEKQGDQYTPHPNPKWSQDVWGLRVGSHLPDSMMKALEIPLGVPRCDNKVAYLFAIRGWAIHNPQSYVRSVHVHETQQRGYDKKADLTVMGGVAYVQPATELDAASRLDFDIWARNVKQIASVKLNPSLDNWLREAEGTASASLAQKRPNDPLPRNSLLPTPAKPTAVCSAPDGPAQVSQALAEGEAVFVSGLRFKVYRLGGRFMAVDSLSPAAAQWMEAPWGNHEVAEHAEALLAAFVPPVVDTPTLRIKDRPESEHDCHFWQYPAATERQAYENHVAIARGANVDASSRIVHTYLGLPWATYIDKKHLPDEVARQVSLRLRGLRRLVEQLGYALRVHTVCQQIHWRRLIQTFKDIGVTDLHLSHAETGLDLRNEAPTLRVHSWPLFAPNIEVPERRVGLTIAKPPQHKRYLATFVGAHMKHYRSDVRVKLAELARESCRSDVLVELGETWHFNQTVYQEQVQHRPLIAAQAEALAQSARRYNELLSDSVFSLCPEGAGPNTLRLWESLATGAIPVVFAPKWRPPQALGGEGDLQSCAVFVAGSVDASLFTRLAAISQAERERMQLAGVSLYERWKRRTAFG